MCQGIFLKGKQFSYLGGSFYKFWISGSDVCLLNQDIGPSCLQMLRKACRREELPPYSSAAGSWFGYPLRNCFRHGPIWTSLKLKDLNEQHGLKEAKTEWMMWIFLFLAKCLHCFLLVQEAPWRSPNLCCCEFCAWPMKAKAQYMQMVFISVTFMF